MKDRRPVGSDRRAYVTVTGPAEIEALAAEGENDTEALIISQTAERPQCERPASDALLYQH